MYIGYEKVLNITEEINECNKLPTDCINASSFNMFINRHGRYKVKNGLTVGNPMVSLSTCYLELA